MYQNKEFVHQVGWKKRLSLAKYSFGLRFTALGSGEMNRKTDRRPQPRIIIPWCRMLLWTLSDTQVVSGVPELYIQHEITPGLQIPGSCTALALFISHPDILFVSYLFYHCSAIYICVQSRLSSCFSIEFCMHFWQFVCILVPFSHPVFIYLIFLTLFVVEYRLLSFSLRNFLHPRVISSLLSPQHPDV